ncbi:MAG: DUF1127 domain-containing protein [Rhodovibrionaceae bacterium]|nr:DUF1127 domain-containing protein [Rhodovibrionaceae bacterium]
MEQVYRISGTHCVDTTPGRFRVHRVRPSDVFAAIANRVLTWQERASQRAQLAAMDDRLLRDMGIHPMDAMREAEKPFWRR